MNTSIIIRTFNEAIYLPELLTMIKSQNISSPAEIVVVDSGSTDETLAIAESFNANIVNINKDDFTFGRSLNVGCAAAKGEALVFISGHCIPENEKWLTTLISPLAIDNVVYSYGRQIGNETSKFSEKQIFAKYFPEESSVPQNGFFCNNANSALLKSTWEMFNFDEQLTGLEDMHLAKSIINAGFQIAYEADAEVYHLHDESWAQIKRRFEREAIALQHIMPEIHITLTDFVRYYLNAIVHDAITAYRHQCLIDNSYEILIYRLMQFWGSYRGNHIHRKLSKKQKESYFFPKKHTKIE